MPTFKYPRVVGDVVAGFLMGCLVDLIGLLFVLVEDAEFFVAGPRRDLHFVYDLISILVKLSLN